MARAPGDEADVAALMAAAWNQAHGAATAAPLDMWPCCQVLARSGLVTGQQEDLSAISLGPFKVAAARNEAPVRDFVEALFPAAVAALPSSTPLASATAGMLTAACLLFVKLLDRGVIFTRRQEDRLRWAVLMAIADSTSEDAHLTTHYLASNKALRAGTGASAADVHAAIDWLLGRGLVAHLPQNPDRLEARI